MDRLRDFIIGVVAFGASMHEAFHYPEINGKKIQATPYLQHVDSSREELEL